jgi:hypothetical protein
MLGFSWSVLGVSLEFTVELIRIGSQLCLEDGLLSRFETCNFRGSVPTCSRQGSHLQKYLAVKVHLRP